MDSDNLPLLTTGDGCLLDMLAETCVSELGFKVAAPGRDLPAETGLSGSVVLRFGGVSRGKSGGTTGWGRRLGELGRDTGAELRPFSAPRPAEVEADGVVGGGGDGIEWRQVGVEGLESDRAGGECSMLAGLCGLGLELELGVDGLGLFLMSAYEVVGTLEEGVVREVRVEGLAADDGERVMGEDGLV